MPKDFVVLLTGDFGHVPGTARFELYACHAVKYYAVALVAGRASSSKANLPKLWTCNYAVKMQAQAETAY